MISDPENPRVPNFSQIGALLNFDLVLVLVLRLSLRFVKKNKNLKKFKMNSVTPKTPGYQILAKSEHFDF